MIDVDFMCLTDLAEKGASENTIDIPFTHIKHLDKATLRTISYSVVLEICQDVHTAVDILTSHKSRCENHEAIPHYWHMLKTMGQEEAPPKNTNPTTPSLRSVSLTQAAHF